MFNSYAKIICLFKLHALVERAFLAFVAPVRGSCCLFIFWRKWFIRE